MPIGMPMTVPARMLMSAAPRTLSRREHEENDEGDRREDNDGLREIAERERDLFRIDRDQLCIAHADHGEKDAHACTD